MSNREPTEIYVFQPYGTQHTENWAAGRIYGVSGPGLHLSTIRGLTKAEAEAVRDALCVRPPETAALTRGVAEQIADDLFRNGSGQKAERLVLELSDGRNGGGWCRRAVVDRVNAKLRATRRRA